MTKPNKAEAAFAEQIVAQHKALVERHYSLSRQTPMTSETRDHMDALQNEIFRRISCEEGKDNQILGHFDQFSETWHHIDACVAGLFWMWEYNFEAIRLADKQPPEFLCLYNNFQRMESDLRHWDNADETRTSCRPLEYITLPSFSSDEQDAGHYYLRWHGAKMKLEEVMAGLPRLERDLKTLYVTLPADDQASLKDSFLDPIAKMMKAMGWRSLA